MRQTLHPVTFKSSELTLEGRLHLPVGAGPFPAVAVCHPHPLYGGDMESSVVRALCQSLPSRGIAALRFNFRGVGGSQGEFAHGAGEVEDAAQAVTYLTLLKGVDAGQVGIAGYSFGARVALQAAAQEGLVAAVALVACPGHALSRAAGADLSLPKLVLMGDQDHVTPPDQFTFLAQRLPDPKEVHLLEGADHFFRGQEETVGDLVAEFFQRWLCPRE
ncbi:MAG: dienelactone hydrolase family protein [Chloroflexi bacterium]|nr:dienelactone hydrolase family protein [Chloroflexota bacterium]